MSEIKNFKPCTRTCDIFIFVTASVVKSCRAACILNVMRFIAKDEESVKSLMRHIKILDFTKNDHFLVGWSLTS